MKRQKRRKQEQWHIHLENRNPVTKTEPDSHETMTAAHGYFEHPLFETNKDRLLIVCDDFKCK